MPCATQRATPWLRYNRRVVDKRYQVFVSSTFLDLTHERQGVIQALLELDAIPAGMELFPASDEGAWKIIQRVIDQSDYYVLIIGGRYGSTDGDGLGFTEKEYDYASKRGVPVLPFLHRDPAQIPFGKSESSEGARDKLAAFRVKVENAHLCTYWTSAEQLGSQVSRALIRAVKTQPRLGWVRADEASSEALAELNRMRVEIERLESQRTEPPDGSENLLQGDSRIPFKVKLAAFSDAEIEKHRQGRLAKREYGYTIDAPVSWNEAFAAVAPLMLHECHEQEMQNALNKKVDEYLEKRNPWYKNHAGHEPAFTDDDFQAIKVQFIALGYIQKSDRKRALTDRGTYWCLTPYGEDVMMRLRALKKSPWDEDPGDFGPLEVATGEADDRDDDDSDAS